LFRPCHQELHTESLLDILEVRADLLFVVSCENLKLILYHHNEITEKAKPLFSFIWLVGSLFLPKHY
jgi:hypothetical protein